jgi:hypothetical protein
MTLAAVFVERSPDTRPANSTTAAPRLNPPPTNRPDFCIAYAANENRAWIRHAGAAHTITTPAPDDALRSPLRTPLRTPSHAGPTPLRHHTLSLETYPQPVHDRTHHAGSDVLTAFPAQARYAAVNPTRSTDYEQAEVVVPPNTDPWGHHHPRPSCRANSRR